MEENTIGDKIFEPATLDQIKEFVIQITDGQIDRWRLRSLLSEKVKLPSDYESARLILGDDFIAPEEIEIARRISYAEKSLLYYVNTVPSESVLRQYKENNYTVIAGPPEPINLYDIYGLNPIMFSHLSDSFYGNWFWATCPDYNNFLKEKKIVPDWLIFKKTPVSSPKAKGTTVENHKKFLMEYERVPDLIETVWGITTYMEVRGRLIVPDGSSFATSSEILYGNNPATFLLGAYRKKISPSLTHHECSGVFSAMKK